MSPWEEGERPPERLTVLLIDDQQEAREMYSRFFSFSGVGVTTAIDGREALELAQRYPPDVVVADVSMPGMNGFEFLRHLRVDPRLATTPVVVMTAYDRQYSERDAYAIGANAYLAKPCLPAVLLAEVRRVARRAAASGSA